MKTLISVGTYFGVHEVFKPLFDSCRVVSSTGRYGEKDVMNFLAINKVKNPVFLFGGGADIHPSLYNSKHSRYSHAPVVPSERDNIEKLVFDIAQKLGAPTIGVCRGAQLQCALSGGSLYQHVTNHSGDHTMITKDGERIVVSSAHHQMMNPKDVKHDLIGWSENVLSRVHLNEDDENLEVEVEPEVILFNDTKSLAFQYHPEFMSKESRGRQYAVALVDSLIVKGDL